MQPEDTKTRCRIIGIPHVDTIILKKRKKMREDQVKLVKTNNAVFEEGSMSKKKGSMSGRIHLKDLDKINCYEQYASDCKVSEIVVNMTAELARYVFFYME